MSVEIKKLVDVRIDGGASTSVIHDAVLGGTNIVQQSFAPTSSSASNLDFVIQTPGLGVYMSRRVNIRADIPVKFTVSPGQATTGDAWQGVWGVNMGACAFPFNSLITTATVQISTSNFTTQVQQTLPLIKRLMQREDIRQKIGEVACELGATHVIMPGSTNSSLPQGLTSGASDYQLAYGNGSMATFKFYGTTSAATAPLSDISGVRLAAGGAATTYYGVLSVEEPLLIQPFSYDDEVPAFINTNLINVRLNLSGIDAALARIIRFGASAKLLPADRYAVTDMGLWTEQIDKLKNSSLRCSFITPPVSAKPPEKSIYPTQFFNPLATSYSTSISPQDFASSTVSVTRIESQVITLNTAPDMLAVYCVPSLPSSFDGGVGTGVQAVTVKGLALEDTLLPIKRLEVTWNNNPSLLATFDSKELWRRTKQNGLMTPFPVWDGAVMIGGTAPPYLSNYSGTNPNTSANVAQGYAGAGRVKYSTVTTANGGLELAGGYATTTLASSGSPVLLALNKDIPVEAGVAAGVAGVYTLKIAVDVQNNLPYDVASCTLYVVPITSQYLVLNVGATSDVINTVATELAVYGTPVTGDVQSKRLLCDGKGGLPAGAMAASARGSDMLTKVIDMTGAGGTSASIVGSGVVSGGAGHYVGAKRFHGM